MKIDSEELTLRTTQITHNPTYKFDMLAYIKEQSSDERCESQMPTRRNSNMQSEQNTIVRPIEANQDILFEVQAPPMNSEPELNSQLQEEDKTSQDE